MTNTPEEEWDERLPTRAQAERLNMLIEECGEVIQAAAKVLRHGYGSYNPDAPHLGDNKYQLGRELSDVRAIMAMMRAGGEFRPSSPIIRVIVERKLRYTHFQDRKAILEGLLND